MVASGSSRRSQPDIQEVHEDTVSDRHSTGIVEEPDDPPHDNGPTYHQHSRPQHSNRQRQSSLHPHPHDDAWGGMMPDFGPMPGMGMMGMGMPGMGMLGMGMPGMGMGMGMGMPGMPSMGMGMPGMRMPGMGFGMPDMGMGMSGMGMPSMEEAMQSMQNAGQGGSYMSSSSFSSSNGPNGYYETTSKSRMGPGGVMENVHAVKDGRTGGQKMKITRGLGSRKKVMERAVNRDGVETRNEAVEGMNGDEAGGFDAEWQEHAGRHLPGEFGQFMSSGVHHPSNHRRLL